MGRILIKNGLLCDPVALNETASDILIEHGIIRRIKKGETVSDARVIDAGGLAVFPGLVDMHVHLRDPGQTHKEDIMTGCETAAAGGVTTVACMPNTSPPVDNPEILEYILEKAKSAKARVLPIGSVSQGMEGKVLTDFKTLKKAGAVAVSDDGKPVENAELFEDALILAGEAGLPVISHCEDLKIIGGGIINKGRISEALGVKGMDRLSEDSITAREVGIAEKTGKAVHIAHVSTAGSVEIIRKAKARGVNVTCETCPHYLIFTEDMLMKKNADYRMNPPLREEDDRTAVTEAVLDGTIDCIVTDHAPHSQAEKADFLTAPNGIVGLETSLAAVLTVLYHKGRCSLSKIARLMALNPARILNTPYGTLEEGAAADITLVDVGKKWTVRKESFHSKSKNTPFDGMEFIGKPVMTIKNGEIVFEDNSLKGRLSSQVSFVKG